MREKGAEETGVLIVDDENLITKLIEKSMRTAGYRTEIAFNGKEAIKCLDKDHYDLVISDVSMPEMDGIDLTKIIKSKYSSDVIIITGQIDQYEYVQFIKFGASDFIKKPIDTEELLLRAKRVLKERQLKEDLAKLHQEFAKSQKLESIGQLAAGIAHEINTPIQYIGDNTDFLKEAFEDLAGVVNNHKKLLENLKVNKADPASIDEMESFIDEIDVDYLVEEIPIAINSSREGIKRVGKIVKSMKEFAHPGSHEKVLTDINHCIKTTCTVTKNEWKYVANMNLELAHDLPLVRCNPDEINQVILNIVINAVHAISDKFALESSKAGEIKISTEKNGDLAEIKISDNGTGIPQKIIDKIFNPFFTTKEIGKGSGQGLAISHSVVVDRHKGKINIESHHGKGTTFIIVLPL